MTVWTGFWLAWIVLFFVGEVPALLNKTEGDTLSEHVWAWFAVKDHDRKGVHRLLRFGLLAFMAWLTLHFLSGGWV